MPVEQRFLRPDCLTKRGCRTLHAKKLICFAFMYEMYQRTSRLNVWFTRLSLPSIASFFCFSFPLPFFFSFISHSFYFSSLSFLSVSILFSFSLQFLIFLFTWLFCVIAPLFQSAIHWRGVEFVKIETLKIPTEKIVDTLNPSFLTRVRQDRAIRVLFSIVKLNPSRNISIDISQAQSLTKPSSMTSLASAPWLLERRSSGVTFSSSPRSLSSSFHHPLIIWTPRQRRSSSLLCHHTGRSSRSWHTTICSISPHDHSNTPTTSLPNTMHPPPGHIIRRQRGILKSLDSDWFGYQGLFSHATSALQSLTLVMDYILAKHQHVIDPANSEKTQCDKLHNYQTLSTPSNMSSSTCHKSALFLWTLLAFDERTKETNRMELKLLLIKVATRFTICVDQTLAMEQNGVERGLFGKLAI